MLTRPALLNPGDTVALICPASPVPSETLRTCINSLHFLGLRPVLLPGCIHRRGYLAGSDRQRALDLNRAFSNAEYKGIFCLRGGYGSPRILPLLDLKTIRENPKCFVGFSDITALHLVFNQRCGFQTFHGPMPASDYSQMDGFSLSSLKENLFSSASGGFLSNPSQQPPKVLIPGKARGILIGGNLTLLVHTLGSPYEINTRGKILFLEETGESLYRIDRSLTALALAGKLRDCRGILLGTFTQTGTSDGEKEELIRLFKELLAPWKKPTLYNLCAGHHSPQITLPLGAEVAFDSQSGRIAVQRSSL